MYAVLSLVRERREKSKQECEASVDQAICKLNRKDGGWID